MGATTVAVLRDRYLARLGLDAEPPSAEALFRLHRAHAERVPYETLWIHLADVWSVDPGASVERIAVDGRGGYCFHLNGAFSELLRELGYDVVRHVGGVRGPDGATADDMANHLVLTVHGLPDDTNPAGDWYVDVGLGDALHEPLPLRAGDYTQGPFRLVLGPPAGELGDWDLTHDPAGWFPGMTWSSEPAPMRAFEPRNQFFATSPESSFVRVLCAARRDGDGVDMLQGLRLRRIGSDASETIVSAPAELAAVLADGFGLHVAEPEGEPFRALWQRAVAAHDAWEAAGRP
jgi:N-hydroxyarylamine O-acetyltransferase